MILRKQKIGKLIWAVDAYAEKGTQTSAARLLQLLSSKTGSSIEPVHVLITSGYPIRADRKSILFFLRRAEEELEAVSKEYSFLSTEPFKVLVQRSGSIRKSVKALLSFATSQNASAIVVLVILTIALVEAWITGLGFSSNARFPGPL